MSKELVERIDAKIRAIESAGPIALYTTKKFIATDAQRDINLLRDCKAALSQQDAEPSAWAVVDKNGDTKGLWIERDKDRADAFVESSKKDGFLDWRAEPRYTAPPSTAQEVTDEQLFNAALRSELRPKMHGMRKIEVVSALRAFVAELPSQPTAQGVEDWIAHHVFSYKVDEETYAYALRTDDVRAFLSSPPLDGMCVVPVDWRNTLDVALTSMLDSGYSPSSLVVKKMREALAASKGE